MIAMIERLQVLVTVRLAWREPRRVGAAIRGFHATEADGVWHLYRGIERLEDPRQKAAIFTHCLEEESHADVFATTWRAYDGGVFSPEHFDRRLLYAADAPMWKTFAFVHVGERDATERFRQLRQALPEGPLRAALGKVVEDEAGHVDSTMSMLTRLGATPAQVRRELLLLRARRLWERWLRAGKRIVDLMATALLSALYFTVGPFVARAARRRLEGGLVEFDNSHPKRL